MAGMKAHINRRAVLAVYVAAATPFLVGVVWYLIFQYREAKNIPPGWIIDSAPPYTVKFLIPVGFYGFIAFALAHICFVLFKKFSKANGIAK
jgi:hypothetical protein